MQSTAFSFKSLAKSAGNVSEWKKKTQMLYLQENTWRTVPVCRELQGVLLLMCQCSTLLCSVYVDRSYWIWGLYKDLGFANPTRQILESTKNLLSFRPLASLVSANLLPVARSLASNLILFYAGCVSCDLHRETHLCYCYLLDELVGVEKVKK